MKPLKLEMTAFESYGDKQTIDFERLTDGVFLITGKTGAGKTAIFDALMFALFGESSGDRSATELRSHFAPRSVKTQVSLTFSHNGKTYRVERIFGTKKDGKADTPKAQLYEDGILFQGAGRGAVTNRVSEIIGLNADQFKNVIMLAQGEFKKFLTSDADEKKELLSKLFDSSLYRKFQETLKQAKNIFASKRQDQYDEIKNQIEYNLKDIPDDISLFYDDEDLSDKIEKVLAADKLKYNELKEKSAAENKEYEKILAARQQALILNKNIDDYYDAQIKYNGLSAKRPYIDAKKEELENAERFMRHINPKYIDFIKSQDALKDIDNRLNDNKNRVKTAEAALDEAQKNAKDNELYAHESETLAARIENLTSSLSKYRQLDQINSELNEAETEEQKAKDELSKTEADVKSKKEELTGAENRLNELKDADLREIEAQIECDRAREALDVVKKAAEASKEIFLNEKEIAELRHKTECAAQDYSQKEMLYATLNKSYIDGTYGIVADEIREKLKENGSAHCPVCGDLITVNDASRLAVNPAETPTLDEVERAEKQKDRAYEALKDCQNDLKGKEKDYQYQKTDVLRQVSKYIPEFEDWDKLTADGVFNAKLKEFRSAEEKAAKTLNSAVEEKEEKQALIKIEENLKKEIENLQENQRQLQSRINEYSVNIAKIKTQSDSIKENLKFESFDSAQKHIEQMTAERDKLKNRIKENAEKLGSAQKELSRLEGIAKELTDSRIKAQESKKSSENDLSEVLKKYGYLSIEHALTAKEPIGSGDPEQWIKNRREEIKEYEDSLLAAQNTERERLKQIADESGAIPAKADTDEITRRLTEREKLKDEAAKSANTQNDINAKHKKAAKEILKRAGELDLSREDYERLSRLSDAANGRAGEKYDFERFALGYIFKEILDAANIRLNTMSGGRYELVHQIGGISKGRGSQIGFEIEVSDITTGKQRDTKSLSGGETFLTSLSLALGLSDVMMSRSGGNKVEAMFIDEGFGTLDPHSLDTALNVLLGLTKLNCQIGIISHVDKLRESIPQKICVTSGKNGSRAEIE